VQRAVEDALAAVLQAQQKNKPNKTTEPPPARKVKRVKAAAGLTKRSHRGFRGLPPPATFSIAELADDALLREYDVAAVGRWSTNTVAAWRKQPRHPLKWLRLPGGRVRYFAGALKQFLATGYKPQPGRPRKKDPAPAPKPQECKLKPSGTPTATTKIHTQEAAPERHRTSRRPRAAAAPQAASS